MRGKEVSHRLARVCTCCRKRSSRVPQILTRRSESALGIGYCQFGGFKWSFHILEYLFERKYDKYCEYACQWAAMNGHLDCLKYLHETSKAPSNYRAVRKAHKNNHPECVQYLLDNNCPLPPGWRYEDGELHVPDSESDSDSELESE